MTTYLLGVASGIVLAPVLLIAACWLGNTLAPLRPQKHVPYDAALAFEGRDRKLARRA